MSAVDPRDAVVMASMRERYAVMLNGCELVGVGLSRREAIKAALEVVDFETSQCLRQVDITEQNTREQRARWCRSGHGWTVRSAPGWLS